HRRRSRIEQTMVSPTVSSLKEVRDGIPSAWADFVTQDLDPGEPEQPFYAADELPEVGANGIHYYLVGQHRPQRQMCILREVMPPGNDTGEAMIAHEGEEGGVVVAGPVEVTVGGRVRVRGPAGAYHCDSRIPHRFRNVGEGEAVIVSANTPATF